MCDVYCVLCVCCVCVVCVLCVVCCVVSVVFRMLCVVRVVLGCVWWVGASSMKKVKAVLDARCNENKTSIYIPEEYVF